MLQDIYIRDTVSYKKGATITELRAQIEGSLNALADATSTHASE